MNYWRIFGTLYPDNRLVLRHGYLDSRARARTPDASKLVVTLYDGDERALLTHPLVLLASCGDGPRRSGLAVRGWVPFPDGVRTVRFVHRDVMIHEVKVSPRSPAIDDLSAPEGQDSGPHVISWRAHHPEGLSLEYFCRYSIDNGQTWQRVGWRTRESGMRIDFDQMPGGERCRVAVVATDGVNTTVMWTPPFAVATKPCQVMLLAPSEGQRIPAGQSLLLQGQGFWLEERRPELENLRWVSSVDGPLGSGCFVECRPRTVGPHRITLSAGAGERTGHKSVTVYYGGGADS